MPYIALPLLLFAATVSGFEPAPQPAPAPPAAAPKANPLDTVVCKSEDGTGGRLRSKKRVCATVRVWQDQAQENREATELLQRQAQTNPH